MTDLFAPAPQATAVTVEPRFQAAQASPAVLQESSASEDVSTTSAGMADSDGAGLRKRKVWSFPRHDEQRSERDPLSEEEWQRVLRGHRTMVFLVTREQREWAGSQAKSCGNCAHVNLNGDPRRGFCLAQKMMTGLTFPVLCREWIAS